MYNFFPRTLDQEPVPWDGAAVLQVFILMFFVEGLILAAEAVMGRLLGMHFSSSDSVLMANSLLRDILVAGFVILLVKKKFKRPLTDLGLTQKNFFRDVRTGVLSYLVIIPFLLLILFLISLVAQILSYEPTPQRVVEMFLRESRTGSLIFFTFFVALLGPAIEEIFFRGFAYKAFRASSGVGRAMVVSALIFAAMHMNVVAFLPIFVLGLFLAYLYERTGSLVPSMTAHMLHNLLMVSLTLGFKSLAHS